MASKPPQKRGSAFAASLWLVRGTLANAGGSGYAYPLLDGVRIHLGKPLALFVGKKPMQGIVGVITITADLPKLLRGAAYSHSQNHAPRSKLIERDHLAGDFPGPPSGQRSHQGAEADMVRTRRDSRQRYPGIPHRKTHPIGLFPLPPQGRSGCGHRSAAQMARYECRIAYTDAP
jgi:hypothetical protein